MYRTKSKTVGIQKQSNAINRQRSFEKHEVQYLTNDQSTCCYCVPLQLSAGVCSFVLYFLLVYRFQQVFPSIFCTIVVDLSVFFLYFVVQFCRIFGQNTIQLSIYSIHLHNIVLQHTPKTDKKTKINNVSKTTVVYMNTPNEEKLIVATYAYNYQQTY